jgi:hypothetical protein
LFPNFTTSDHSTHSLNDNVNQLMPLICGSGKVEKHSAHNIFIITPYRITKDLNVFTYQDAYETFCISLLL